MTIKEAKKLRGWLDDLESVQCEIGSILKLQEYRFPGANLHESGSGTLLVELDDGDRSVILEALLTRRYKRENNLKKLIEQFEK